MPERHVNGRAEEVGVPVLGEDSEAKPRARRPDPTNGWSFAWRAMEKYGILAVICALLFYGAWKILQNNRSDAEKSHEAFRAEMHEETQGIKDMSAAMRDMSASQNTTNLELIKIGNALQQHLEEDRKRGH